MAIVNSTIVVPASTDAWLSITTPITCSYFRIWNISGGWGGYSSANVRLRTDPNDALTEIPLNNGSMEIIDAASTSFMRHRFASGVVLYYVRSTGIATAVMLTCID